MTKITRRDFVNGTLTTAGSAAAIPVLTTLRMRAPGMAKVTGVRPQSCPALTTWSLWEEVFGRIAIANSDSVSASLMQRAVEQAWRAVKELS